MSSLYLSSLYGLPQVDAPSVTQQVANAQSAAANAAATRIAALSQNLTSLKDQSSALVNRTSAYGSLVAALQTFSSTLDVLRDSTRTAGIVAQSTSTKVAVVMGANARPSTHVVAVSQLAHAQQNVSNYVLTKDRATHFGDGTLTIQVGQQQAVSVQLHDQMTLVEVADAINGQGLGVDADILADDNGYRLQLSAEKTGANNKVTYTETGVDLGLSANATQEATDFVGKVDGVDLVRSSNIISDAIAGTTLSFSDLVDNATINLVPTANGAAAAVQSFVAAYNALMSGLNTAQTNQPDASMLDTLRQQMGNVVGRLATGRDGTYAALAQVGVLRNADDTLRIDANLLAQAASRDPFSVGSLLSGNAGGTNGVAADLRRISQDYASPGTGILQQNQYGLTTQSIAVARALQTQANYVEANINIINANNAFYQTKLAQLTADALLVQLLPLG